MMEALDWPFEVDGAEEIALRVSRRYEDGSPACYQCFVKGADPRRVWGLGMRPTPAGAVRAAIEDWHRRDGALWPGGKPVGTSREAVAHFAAMEVADVEVEDLLA